MRDSTGSKIAIGSQNDNNNGTLKIYYWDGSNYVQMSDTKVGEASNDLFGSHVSFSDNGSVIAVGAIENDGGGNNSGHVRLFGLTSSSSNTLAAGQVVTYTATYTVDQQAVDSGLVSNSVLDCASSPGNTNNVTDRSDDGDDSDGNTTNDPTETNLSRLPAIEATKTATVTDNNNNNVTDLGDTVVYTIAIENKGNVTLSGVGL